MSAPEAVRPPAARGTRGRRSLVVYAFPFAVTPGRGSGVERYAAELVTQLTPSHPDLVVVAQPGSRGVRRYFASVTTVPLRTLAVRARLFHGVSPYSSRMLFALRRRPVITTVHDIIFREWVAESPDFFERRRRSYNEMAIRRSDLLIVPFQYTKARIQELYGVPPERIAVVNYGVDLTRFRKAGDAVASREERGWDVLFLGGVNALARGGRAVLEVYQRLLASRPELRLALSVSGPHESTLRDQARERGIVDRLQWIGFVPEEALPGLLADSRVFLYPTQMGFSFLHMQAMAAGAAVVSSDVFDVPEFARDAAILHGREDVEGYATSIGRLLDTPSERTQVVARAKRRVAQFSPAAMAAATAQVYARF